MGSSPAQIIADRYRLLHTLGRGGFGHVYAAERLDDGLPVAIKILRECHAVDTVARARFVREAELARQLRHPNIVSLVDCGHTPEDAAFIVFERLEGRTLSIELKLAGRFDAARVCDVARQVLRALVAAQRLRIVHRDLKPSNVFVCDEGPEQERVKVLDFGLAKALADESHTTLTESGQMLGTPYYMAPEQVRAVKDLDERSDLYALGLIMAELLTGERLVGGDAMDAYIQHIEVGPHVLPDAVLATPLAGPIVQAVAKSRDARPASAAAMLAELDRRVPAMGSPPAGKTLVLGSGSGRREGGAMELDLEPLYEPPSADLFGTPQIGGSARAAPKQAVPGPVAGSKPTMPTSDIELADVSLDPGAQRPLARPSARPVAGYRPAPTTPARGSGVGTWAWLIVALIAVVVAAVVWRWL